MFMSILLHRGKRFNHSCLFPIEGSSLSGWLLLELLISLFMCRIVLRLFSIRRRFRPVIRPLLLWEVTFHMSED